MKASEPEFKSSRLKDGGIQLLKLIVNLKINVIRIENGSHEEFYGVGRLLDDLMPPFFINQRAFIEHVPRVGT